MSEPITRLSESAVAGAAAGLAASRAGVVRMLTQDDLPYDDGDWSERTANLRMPTQDDLPYDDGEPMESERHLYQMMLLIETLKQHWAGRDDFFIGGNMAVYFSSEQVKKKDFRGPDFFLVLDVDGKRERKSWVVWDEGKSPDLVIELLSESTAEFDREGKKQIYSSQLRVSEYYYYDPFSGELAAFKLDGISYLPIEPTLGPDKQEQVVSCVTGLALTRWTGEYLGVTGEWLRWQTLDGKLLLTEKERAELLAAKLRELGVDPSTLI